MQVRHEPVASTCRASGGRRLNRLVVGWRSDGHTCDPEQVSSASDTGPTATGTAPQTTRIGPVIVALALLTAVGPLSIDMYVPGFPAMGRTLGASSSAVQLTMTAFLAGIVVGQLVVGPISDAIGRRGLLLGGTLAYALLSAACAMAVNVELLIGFRLLQGLCGAIGMVLSKAVLTDRYAGPALPRAFALLSQIMGVAPVVAPVLGGLVLSIGSWRLVFAVLTLVGIGQCILVLIMVPESLPAERRHGGSLGRSFGLMGRLLIDRSFIGYMVVSGFSGAALFSYISTSSFIFEGIHHVAPSTYSLIFASNAIGLVIAGQIFARLSRRLRLNRLLVLGLLVALGATVAQLILLGLLGETLLGTWFCLFATLLGAGIMMPASQTIGQMIGRDSPGSAAALLGATSFLFGAAASPIAGLFSRNSSLPMVLIMLGAYLGGVLGLLLLARPWLGRGEVSSVGHDGSATGHG